jgi:hypothetical protein
MGEEFVIFQDRKHISWGQNWKERIEESLDGATFLIPIITPSFFNSSYCRDELQRFLDRERNLNRSDLILPVYYVSCPLLDDEAKRANNEMAQVIAGRQNADWRELRFESFDSPQVTRTLSHLAIQIREALERTRQVQIIRQLETTSILQPQLIETTKVELTIEMEMERFDEKYQRLLQHALAGFLAISPNAVRIISTERGSVKVTVELPAQSAKKLFSSYRQSDSELVKHLKTLKVSNLRQSSDSRLSAPVFR